MTDIETYVEGHAKACCTPRGKFECWSIKITCPFCGKTHYHGGGNDPTRPDGGHRLAHCRDRLGRHYTITLQS